MKPRILFIFLFCFFYGCKEDVLPKPNAFLRLDFPKAEYKYWERTVHTVLNPTCFQKVKKGDDCSLIVDYPMMKGSIYITYKRVNENLNQLLVDAQKLSYEHVLKADNILEQPFVNESDEVYGMFYEVTGNAASQSQFYATDSLNHFVTGSLYFYAKPNYDSIYPAAIYLQKDIRRIMESLEWKD